MGHVCAAFNLGVTFEFDYWSDVICAIFLFAKTPQIYKHALIPLIPLIPLHILFFLHYNIAVTKQNTFFSFVDQVKPRNNKMHKQILCFFCKNPN